MVAPYTDDSRDSLAREIIQVMIVQGYDDAAILATLRQRCPFLFVDPPEIQTEGLDAMLQSLRMRRAPVYHPDFPCDEDVPYVFAGASPFQRCHALRTVRPALYICAQCGTDHLQVGACDYLTVLRCPACAWEIVIHEG